MFSSILRRQTAAVVPNPGPMPSSQLMALAVGGAGVAAGGVYLVGTTGAPALLTSALLVGAGAAAISAAFTVVSAPVPSSVPGPTRSYVRPPTPVAPRRSPAPPALVSPGHGRPFGLALQLVHPTIHHRSSAASLGASAPVSAGDRVWATMLPTGPGVLPVELIGPIRESPPDPMEFDSSPVVEQFLFAAELPIFGAPSMSLGAPESAMGVYGYPDLSPPAPPSLVSDWISVEALTPIPPHLRVAPAGPGVDGPARRRRPVGPSGLETACATCSAALADLPEWRRCSVCRSPMCLRCTLEVLQAEGRGWCSQCRGLDGDTAESAAS